MIAFKAIKLNNTFLNGAVSEFQKKKSNQIEEKNNSSEFQKSEIRNQKSEIRNQIYFQTIKLNPALQFLTRNE